jgi:predicted metal-dependent enzyme (double-stranded beta helix superfamily)
MQTVKIDKLIGGLKSISEEEFTCDNVYTFLSDNPVDVDSIDRYFFWDPDYYTRNLIYRDDRFEMLAICWEAGQASTVHNHADQKCWMTVPVGRLKGQNFGVIEMDDSRNYCKLSKTDAFELSHCITAKVELEQPIHQILNLAEYGQRAVSIHIYSKPFDRCLSYCRDTHTYKEVELCYTSIRGKLLTKTAH